MNAMENLVINLAGHDNLWIVQLFIIVLAAVTAGYILNKIIDRLELHTDKTATVWDDAFIKHVYLRACFN